MRRWVDASSPLAEKLYAFGMAIQTRKDQREIRTETVVCDTLALGADVDRSAKKRLSGLEGLHRQRDLTGDAFHDCLKLRRELERVLLRLNLRGRSK